MTEPTKAEGLHAMSRRQMLATTGAVAGAMIVGGGPATGVRSARATTATDSPDDAFRISLAQWSLHRSFFGESLSSWESFGRALDEDPDSVLQGELDPLDFAEIARSYGLDGIEYVNTFFFGHARDRDYLGQLKTRAEDHGVESLLIMCDREGALVDPDTKARQDAVARHVKWLEAAKFLGCHSIRVNAQSEGSFEEQQKLAAEGLHALCERAEEYELSVLVENHGGLSSNGAWLAGVMQKVDHPAVGTLPDFGNFRVQSEPEVLYDRYQGVTELMPFARAVSAKSHDFNEAGDEIHTDYRRMVQIVLDAGYDGWIGIEYEGRELSEKEGIEHTRDLLERVREELAKA